MDRRVALELLGLETAEPITHDRLRRAYLRRLRAHPPERDPDGFRRLREAFEQIEPWARFQDHMRAVADERAASGAPADGADATERDASSEPSEPSEPAPKIVIELDDGRRVEVRPATPVPPGAPARRADADAASDEPPLADPPVTLSGMTDDILALFQAGKLDAALDLAERCSALDDHREVSPHDAQRWALTRELIDVAPALPDPLRRAIAHAIASDKLTAARTTAATYRAAHPARANDLARHLAKRAPHLYQVLGPVLGHRHTPRKPSQFSRAPLWLAVILIWGLARLVHSCDSFHTTDRVHYLRNLPQDGNAPRGDGNTQPLFDPRRYRPLDPRLDPDRWPPTGGLGSHPMIELRSEGQIAPSSP